MSSSHNNSTSSSSTQSSLPAGATTGANNLNRQETATTSTQLPNSVADPLVDEYIYVNTSSSKLRRSGNASNAISVMMFNLSAKAISKT
ncbi:hypothetical protein F2Q68_00046542 [Brassica cretica]|uniref:Uncharacterized protein n=1 Tax=Brassica cretica TaxID=69181 RepID=A0A8S9LLF9_BRACR|nr:hypothetical protein F2Q68_00046542 [Brassica cretica]